MKRSALLFCTTLLVISYSARSQEYSYTHYDITDGLAGSVVYCITQDKDGFIWAGTETGLSRFDGTHFRNYTEADGLPDIEILNMFADSKGRVWMAPFRKAICYHYHGRFHNQNNDPLLHQIHLISSVESFAEDAAGNILIREESALVLITVNGKIREFDSIAGQPIRQCSAISASADGHFLVQTGQKIYKFNSTGFELLRTISLFTRSSVYIDLNPNGMIWQSQKRQTTITSFRTGRTVTFPFAQKHYRHLTFGTIGDSLFYLNEFWGATEYNLFTGEKKRYLPGVAVSRTYRDANGNTWFTTMGQGIFRLNSDEFKTIHIQGKDMEQSAIHCIRQMGKMLMVGDNHNFISSFSLPDMTLKATRSLTGVAKNRIVDIGPSPNGNFWLASDRGIEGGTPDYLRRFSLETPVKSTWLRNHNELLVSNIYGVEKINLSTFRVEDTLWRERSTAVYARGDTTYVGTLTGLYCVMPDKSAIFLGKDIPVLRSRIAGMGQSTDGMLWVATYDAGVIGYRKGQVVVAITKRQGLTSDICRTMLVHDNILWIGTDKGLNKVNLKLPNYPVTRYTHNDGLGSDMINCLYADSAVIYVGTPAGFSYFNETKVNVSEGCRLHLLSIFNSGKERIGDSAHLLIPYSDKHVRFEFAGISYRSVGSILYRYKMIGLDTGWQETKETFLEYPTLPSGKYTFQLQAVNKFGIRSTMLSMPFEVITPFWQTAWFYALIIAGSLGLIWLFVSLRIKNIRRRQREKDELNLRLIDLEHTALQAQMNPHFIFNCLNSIQQYIFDNEALAANRYLTGFSRLIRATLNNSSKTFIPLADEIDYLSTYLSLEKSRFKQKMDYAIDVAPEINTAQYNIPPMLIQPFVENSMRHGLRHKTSGKGYIHIRFEQNAKKLQVTVEDNGIGRKQAALYKTREHIEYQSKGMSLTADRIRNINAKYNDNIDIDVIDLEDQNGQPAGTRVVMQFPLFHTTPQKEMI